MRKYIYIIYLGMLFIEKVSRQKIENGKIFKKKKMALKKVRTKAERLLRKLQKKIQSAPNKMQKDRIGG